MKRPIHRHVHFDFHTMPGIYDFNRDWDAAAFAQRMADAHVDYVNVFAQCNLGFAYYPTKIGIPYPGMKGDMLGDTVRECHKRGIGVTAYINVGLMHEQARQHPEWCRLDKDGQIIRGDRTKNFFRTMCYNNHGYHDYLLSLIKEICAYDIDGLFCDCMHFFPCHCTQCTDDMIARGIDINDENAVKNFSREVMFRVSSEIKEIVGPDRYAYFNGMPYYEYRNLQTHVEIECLPSGGWGYDFFWPHASYARNIQKTVLYMTGRFQASWGDFGGYKGKESIENDVFDALCNNFLPSVGDHMHPAGIPERDIYKDVGEIYERVIAYEPYTQGAHFVSDIGVLTFSPGYLGDEYAGLARMLGELKLGFDIVHEDMDLSRFKLLILPENMTVTDALAEKLRAHLAKGGKILSAGTGALKRRPGETYGDGRFDGEPTKLSATDKKAGFEGFALEAYDFLNFEGIDQTNASYFKFVNQPAELAEMAWSDYEPGIEMTAKNPDDVRAIGVKAYFNKGWDGKHGYYYAPPEKENGLAAAALCGNVAHIAFSVFAAYNHTAMKAHKLLVAQLIDALLPEPMVKAVKGIPSTARVTTTGKDDYILLHVKVTYPEPRGKFDIVEEHNVLPEGAKIAVRGEYKEIVRLPEKTPVAAEIKDGYTVLTLPEITGYDMFMLK